MSKHKANNKPGKRKALKNKHAAPKPPSSVSPAFSKVALPGSVIAALIYGVGSLSSAALFTDQDTVAGNAFTSSTLDISQTAASSLSIADAGPSTRISAPITVKNEGTIDLRYSITGDVTNPDGKDMGTYLQVRIKSGVTSCTNAGYDATGTTIRNLVNLKSVAPGKLVGDSAQGQNAAAADQQSGDRIIAPGASEVLCFQLYMPENVPTSITNASTVAKFSFISEQVVNNP